MQITVRIVLSRSLVHATSSQSRIWNIFGHARLHGRRLDCDKVEITLLSSMNLKAGSFNKLLA